MGIPRGELYGAIMGFPLIILVLLVATFIGIVAGQPKVHQEDLVLCARLMTNKKIGCLDVCMHIFFAMDVLQHIQLQEARETYSNYHREREEGGSS